jgi:anti-sigma factor RsiW
MNCEPVQRLLDAHLDDELDRATSAAVSQHLAGCPACAGTLRARLDLRDGLRGLPRHDAPPSLRAALRRELDHLDRPAMAAPWHGLRRRAWLVGLGAVAGGAGGFALGVRVATPPAAGDEHERVIARHVASLGADGAPHIEVASADRHTVKPWFAGKLDFAPPVRDLAAHGFLLLGGRLDQIAGRPAAVVVYRLRRHLVSLFVMRSADVAPSPVAAATRRGFALVSWASDGLSHTAVSDVDVRELQRFADLLIATPPAAGSAPEAALKGR